ncbi:MAG: hypothetical protein IRY99_24290 [Isosphaeraceae bacterium]|nr:hypothetical protein [Isosphaeraceae bacterium]
MRRKRAEGWLISHGHTHEFFSKRSTRLDIESPEECHALMERVVRELGMFVGCEPWTLDPRSGRVELWRGWKPEDFAAAKVLYRAEMDQSPRSEQVDAKLIFDPPVPYTRHGTKIILE